MTATLLFVAFALLMLAGVPIGAALGLAGATAIAVANADSQWFGLLAVPQNFYAGLGKYPLLAIPMFVLVGSIFDRSGVALRLVNLAVAIVGRGPGMLPLVAIGVAMFMGGISGSGPATAAAIGGVMLLAMQRAGYPPAYSASVVAAAASTDILIPPLGGLHRLFGAGAGGLGAGAFCRRHGARHSGRLGAGRSHRVARSAPPHGTA